VSAYRRFGGADGIDAAFTQAVTPSVKGEAYPKYSLNRYFGASTGTVKVQFRYVPINSAPWYNWSEAKWYWPTNTSTYAGLVDATSSGGTDTTTQLSHYVDVYYSELPVAGTYRLWMFVDYLDEYSETDSGDNMVPTNYTVTRT